MFAYASTSLLRRYSCAVVSDDVTPASEMHISCMIYVIGNGVICVIKSHNKCVCVCVCEEEGGGCPWKFYSMHIINSFVVRGLAVLSRFECSGINWCHHL